MSNLIDRQKTTDAVPVRRGKWERWLKCDSSYYELLFKCSVCGESESVPTRMYKPIWRYCPHCGHPMEVDDE